MAQPSEATMWPKPRKKWQELDPDEVARQINEEYYAEQRKLKREEKKRKLKGEPAPEQKPEEQKVTVSESEEDAATAKKKWVEFALRTIRQKEKQQQENLNWELINSIAFGRLEDVAFILNKGADINAQDCLGQTALMIAAYYGRIGILRLLLGRGADVHRKTKMGRTILRYLEAAWDPRNSRTKKVIINLLKKHGATI
jgi:hypothetical protein